MNLLGIDCSSDTLCVAVRRTSAGLEGSALSTPAEIRRRGSKHPYREAHGHEARDGIVILEIDAGLRHAQLVLSAVKACLDDAGLAKESLELLACASGPGSFTGLRIAMSTIKGLSSALSLPFVAVPTLDCIAADWSGASPVILPVLNAQRGRFYTAVYEYDVRTSGYLDLSLVDLLELVDTFQEILIVGPDSDLLDEQREGRPGLRIARYGRRAPGRALLDLAETRFRSLGPAPSDESPQYVRKSDAEEHENGIRASTDGTPKQ